MTPTASRLAGNRLHLQNGPIDLVIGVVGGGRERETAYEAAIQAFGPVLRDLVAELDLIRRPIVPGDCPVTSPVARAMAAAVQPFADQSVSPMAAVAGGVADHVLAAMIVAVPGLAKAYVNNGGDIAVHLSAGARFEVGLIAEMHAPGLAGSVTLTPKDGIGGIATSGAGGRSFSLGIADAVTVLAATAAEADAAATVIANAVDLPDHPAVERAPATEEDPDSDLGDRLVTLSVGALSATEVAQALDRGRSTATALLGRGLIKGAALTLAGHWRTVGIAAAVSDDRPELRPAARLTL